MRTLLRALIPAVFVALAAFAFSDQPWHFDASHRIVWGDRPFVPVGVRVDKSPASINKAADEGFRSVCVEVPANGEGWTEAFDTLQKRKLTYLLSINSLANYADGYCIEPEGFRITTFPDNAPIQFTIPGASSVFAVLVTSRDGDILRAARVNSTNGHFSFPMKKPIEDDAVLILYPRMVSSELPDYYEGLDQQRDRLLASLKRMKSTTGLRGIVNPLGTTVRLPAPNLRFVPSSPYFHYELAQFIERKYRLVETAERSWSMRGPDFTTFDQLANLVPMWSDTRGVLFLWDTSTDKTYPVDGRNSRIWSDIRDVINLAARRRVQRLTTALHDLVQVPVIQEWEGWGIPYEGGQAVDGVGMQTTGTSPSELLAGAARAASSVLRWNSPGWLLATRMDLSKAKPDAVQPAVQDLLDVGATGIYAVTDDPAVRKSLVAVANSLEGSPPSGLVTAFYYPEAATFPAEPQRMPGGVWWLPAPFDGNRLDLGSEINGYRFRAEDGTGDAFVYWVPSGELETRLRMADPKGAVVRAIDGTPIITRVQKDGIDVKLTSTPIVVTKCAEIPIPSQSYEEVVQHFTQLVFTAEQNHLDSTQQSYIFGSDAAGFDRGPGGAYLSMLEQLQSLGRRVSRTTVIEGETIESATLGERTLIPGCSHDAAFRFETKLDIPGQYYRATYQVPARVGVDQDVWIAARVPEPIRKLVRVSVGSQSFPLPETPVSPYGLGFAWYHIGVTRFTQSLELVFEVDGRAGFDVALDTIVVTPTTTNFVPNGVRLPDPIVYATMPDKKGKKRR